MIYILVNTIYFCNKTYRQHILGLEVDLFLLGDCVDLRGQVLSEGQCSVVQLLDEIAEVLVDGDSLLGQLLGELGGLGGHSLQTGGKGFLYIYNFSKI